MSSNIDKRWMKLPRNSPGYIRGVGSFVEFVRKSCPGRSLFSCPCKLCFNHKGLRTLSDISFDLLKNGVCLSYTTWRHHGECVGKNGVPVVDTIVEPPLTEGSDENVREVVNEDGRECMDQNGRGVDSMNENVRGVDENVRGVDENVTAGVDEGKGTSRCSNKSKSKYDRAREPLYPSCPKLITPLYAAIKLNNIKTQYGFSDNGVTALLELIRELLPEGNTMPCKFYEVKRMIQELGMDYVTYDACVNDCILYWKTHSLLVKCPVCREPRYVQVFDEERKLTKVPQKTLRHFKIIERLKRLYSIPWIAEAMVWHFRAQKDINLMRHPCDSSAWRCADEASPEFAKEPRNVTLGIATDGFNPNGCFGAAHSAWPVILCPYNLPPSMCMKREFSMLCLLISGPRAPGKDIDVYLQPLIEELKQLWDEGVLAFDSFTNTEFLLKARLLWSIHDFPALGTLSGCKTHGYYACPTCGIETVSQHLPYSKKICYMGHRRWLPSNHKYRDDKANFDGKVERRTSPWPLTGEQVQEILANIESQPVGKGKVPKKRKRGAEEDHEDVADEESDRTLFTRRSILYDLGNWGSNAVRHCTDVMHTEKNITEHIINTIFGNVKSKDGPNARRDLEFLGIKKRLWLKENKETGKVTMEPGLFALKRTEKVQICSVFKSLRMPIGFCSNLRNNISVSPPELKTMKSHDYHVIMQHLFPLLVHMATSLPKDLRVSLLRISIFFNILCAKVINREHLLKAKASLVEAMCVLEKYFPPSFFVISIHLMIHLADEALICGPVRFRWMYPFERLMKGFKGLVRNKRFIEGCIAVGYTLREASLFLMEDMSDDGGGTHKHTRVAWLDDDDEFADEMPLSTTKGITLTHVQFEQARSWMLSKYVGFDDWQRKYEVYVNADGQKNRSTKQTSKSFHLWLRDELVKENETDSVLWRLVQGPLFKAQSYSKYQVNGFTFSTKGYEKTRVYQNSGVSMKAITRHRAKSTDTNYKEAEITYYGVIKEIFSLNFVDFEETVFYCDWVRVEDKNAYQVDPVTKLIKVKLSKMKSIERLVDEPFILASEATQVFYSEDVTDDGWSVVLHSQQRLTSSVDDLEIPSDYQSVLTDNKNFETLISLDSVMASVEVNEFGIPVSKNATTIGHRKGALVRTHVPISYTSWDLVPEKCKNDIWTSLKEEFPDLPEVSKRVMLKTMNGPWRRKKNELRRKYYDKKPTHEERIAIIPPNVTKEDWIQFCENEREERAERARIENKRKREQYEYTHTTGRKTHAQLRHELEVQHPEVQITTSHVWLKAHTQDTGDVLESAKPYAEKLAEKQKEIKDKLDAGLPVEEPCDMIAAFGPDSRGRTRALGPISRTQLELSAPAVYKVAQLKAKEGAVSQKVDYLGDKLEILIDGFGTLCSTVKELQSSKVASIVGSNISDCNSREGPSCSGGVVGSPRSCSQPNVMELAEQNCQPASGRQRCTLLNMESEVIATGKLCTGELGKMIHCKPVPEHLAKVALDKIYLPSQLTVKDNMLATTFKEVGVGGFVVHPKMCIKYD